MEAGDDGKRQGASWRRSLVKDPSIGVTRPRATSNESLIFSTGHQLTGPWVIWGCVHVSLPRAEYLNFRGHISYVTQGYALRINCTRSFFPPSPSCSPTASATVVPPHTRPRSLAKMPPLRPKPTHRERRSGGTSLHLFLPHLLLPRRWRRFIFTWRVQFVEGPHDTVGRLNLPWKFSDIHLHRYVQGSDFTDGHPLFQF